MATERKPTTKELLVQRQRELAQEIAQVEAEVQPLRDRQAALRAKIAPFNDELRGVNAKIRALEQPRLVNLKNEYAALARALSAKSMRVETGSFKTEG